MDLATGSAICNQAIQFVTQKKEQLDTMQKIEEIKIGETKATTTNDVF